MSKTTVRDKRQKALKGNEQIGAILNWLVQDFHELFSRDGRARVALWFDAKSEFKGILDAIVGRFQSEGMTLLPIDPSESHGPLWLKWAAESGPGAGTRVVLWLPYDRKQVFEGNPDGTRLDYLLEYAFSGLTWLIDGKPPTLFGFLRKHGVPLPTSRAQQDPLWRGDEDSLLAKYVIANVGRDEVFWQGKVLAAPVIEESIVGNLEERLLRFLADPRREWEVLQDKGIASEFVSQVGERYADTSGVAQEPEKWAYEFVASLILLEIYDSTGEPGDFPFLNRLPAQKYRPNQREFVKRWMRDRDYVDTYRGRALDVDQELDLAEWAEKQGGRPQVLLSLARHRWERFLVGLREQGSSHENLQLYLWSCRSQAIEESKVFWAKATGDLPGWSLVVDLIDLVQSASRAINQASSVNQPAELVEKYLEEWHQIDYAHWRLLSAARKNDEMELLAAVADRFYSEYLDKVGRAFYESIRDTGRWPPRGCKGVTEILLELYSQEGGPQAVMVVDALRFDLAQALQKKLGDAKLQAVIATVPSETYVGMTSLVPNSDVQLDLEGKIPKLVSKNSAGDLSYRSNRWKLLEAAGASPLGTDKKGRRRDEIHHLARLTKPPKKLPPLLLLFNREVDQLGHQTGYEIIRYVEESLEEIARAVRRLKNWGYRKIHVVTDHGFILLHSPSDIQQMEVEKDSFEVLGKRYGFVKPGEKVELVTVPFALDPSWSVALAPGIRCFSSSPPFLHGGATLQEVVIPHLSIETKAERQKMGLRATVPQVEIASLAVKVELIPEAPERQSLYEEEPEPVRVRVFVGKDPENRRSTEKLVEIGPNDKEVITVTLFLHREPRTPTGTEIPVQVIDVESNRSYSSGLFVRAARDLD